QDGTMAGNPASMPAGIACLEVWQADGVYETLVQLGERLDKGIVEQEDLHGIPTTVNRLRGALNVYYGDGQVRVYSDADASDGEAFVRFYKLMLRQGINLAPSKFEAWFLTTAHTEADIDEAIQAVGHAFAEMAENEY